MISKKSCIGLISALLTWLVWTPCLGQQKYERESSIKSDGVPQAAADFVSSVFRKSKVHWYGEESLTGKSIEAKLKNAGRRYSIEFGESGNIQDVEILSNINRMQPDSRGKLEVNLNKEFSHYKIVKTQLHWKGSVAALKESVAQNIATKGVVTRYELILQAKKDKTESYYEVLAEETGMIVSVHQIVQRNTDNLIF